MQQELKQALASIQGVKIPELPSAVLELEQELNSRFCNLATVVKIIEQNISLSGEAIRIANSPAIKPKTPILTIRDAVNNMGLNNLYNLVVSAAYTRMFGDNEIYRDMLNHSVDIALVMAYMTEYVQGISRDKAYMVGLFHNVGALMYAKKSATAYKEIFTKSLSFPYRFLEDEVYIMGGNHCYVGMLIAKKWKLPIDVISAIMLHHTEKVSTIQNDDVRMMVSMLKVANAIISEVSLGAYRGEEMKAYEKDGINELMLTPEAIKDIRHRLLVDVN